MSSWQQAIADDLRKGKRPRENVVVLNRNQEKNFKTGRESPDVPPWTCPRCSSEVEGTNRRCEKCKCLRPDETDFRRQMRERDGEIGRGGGFFQRASADDRRDWHSDDEDVDEFGRKKKRKKPGDEASADAAARSQRSATPGDSSAGAGAAGGNGARSAAAAGAGAMSERQRRALERLQQKARGGV
eukprot:TRINITY_DN74110_c0_g1_i1.p1 TRINITY_DN74110_c0_g1~~TRINITY_DN74110_c0_g1_i1.p1  ORF type:complete len:186 (+),score=44.73 TRINITY_DN74110_c0_g1_i1:128-685(+)